MASHGDMDGSESSSPADMSSDPRRKEITKAFDTEPGDDFEDSYHALHGTTQNDKVDMSRMGKTQELRRDYRPLSALAFTVILQGTWEVLLVATTQGMVDGGLAGLFWSYVWTWLGFSTVMASLAEMASMAPTAGGQYHWVSEFAPPSIQKPLSYVTGWMATLSWQAGTASGPFLVGTLIQALIYVNDTTYVWENWHGTLLVIGITLIVFAANVWGARGMPMAQNLMLVVHVFGFISVIAVFWALAPHNSAKIVFTRFTNDGGWNSMGLSLMVGQISAIYACICSDAAAHMAEEIKDAGITVPRAMAWAYILNGGLGFVFLISFLFAITDLETALNDETGYPFLTVFASAVSTAGVNGLTAIVTVLIFAGTLSFNLSTSRQTWAFARDAGLPFSKFIAHVHPGLKVPANSVGVTAAITIILSLINIGSDVAFNAIISLNLVSLMLTYMVSIGCVLYRRVYHPELLPQCRWSLGRAGVPINAAGFLYSTFAFFWCFWPNETPVTKENFNWSVVMFFAILVICAVDWVVRGRRKFTGPVVLVDGWTGPRTG